MHRNHGSHRSHACAPELRQRSRQVSASLRVGNPWLLQERADITSRPSISRYLTRYLLTVCLCRETGVRRQGSGSSPHFSDQDPIRLVPVSEPSVSLSMTALLTRVAVAAPPAAAPGNIPPPPLPHHAHASPRLGHPFPPPPPPPPLSHQNGIGPMGMPFEQPRRRSLGAAGSPPHFSRGKERLLNPRDMNPRSPSRSAHGTVHHTSAASSSAAALLPFAQHASTVSASDAAALGQCQSPRLRPAGSTHHIPLRRCPRFCNASAQRRHVHLINARRQ